MAFTPGKTSEIQLEAIADSVGSLDTKFGTLGQKTMAGSAPVVIASDQSTIPVSGSITIPGTVAVTQSTSPWVVSGTVAATQSGTWNITNISGTISLPTGASTEATLSTLNTKFNSNYGAASGAIRVAAQIGNASAVADFNAGTTGAQTLRVVLPTDQSAIPVTQSGTWNIGTVTPGTGATNLGKAEDAAHTTGDTGVMMLGVRNDTASALAGTTGDYIPLTTDNAGRLHARATEFGTSGLPNYYQNVAGVYELPAGFFIDPISLAICRIEASGGIYTSGDTAHDAADAGFPVKIGGKSQTEVTQPTAVSASGDRVNAFFDLNGFHHVKANATRGTMTTLHSAVVFNNTTTSSNSSSLDVTRYRALFLYLVLTESGAATSITIVPQFSPDAGTTWCDFRDWEFADLVYVTAQMPINECLQINAAGTGLGRLFRLRAVAAGTTAGDTITLTSYVEGIA